MRRLRAILIRLRGFFGRARWEVDLDDELNSNLELHIEDNLRAGMSPEAARRAAILRFGGMSAAKEAYRDRKVIPSLGDLGRDVRYSARSLWRNKGFSFVVVTTLALCIAANAAIFSALYGLVLKPLPFRDPGRLFQVINVEEHGASMSNSHWSQYIDFKKNADLFEGFALLYGIHKPLDLGSGTMRVKGQSVSADLFELMGVKPLLGRFFVPEENTPGNHRVVVLPQTVWENEYDADPRVIGQTMRFGGEAPFTIIGVAPRSIEVFDRQARFFVPFLANNSPQDRYLWPVDLWARLKEGVSREAGLAQLKALERRWLDEVANPERYARNKDRIEQIELTRSAALADHLLLLQTAALFLFVVGCANVVNLLLSRVGHRRHELCVRRGLGAGKLALARLMLMESLLLAAVGAAAGTALVWAGLRVMNRYVAVLDPSAAPVTLSAVIVGVLLLAAVAVALIMGLLPIALVWRAGLLKRIDSSARNSSVGGSGRRLSNHLVVAQVAIALILLVGAGLLVRSFNNVLAVDPGFDATRVIRGRVDLQGTYGKHDTAALRQRVVAAMEEIPGVENVAWAQFESFTVNHRRHAFYLRAVPQNWGEGEVFPRQVVSPGYFATMGVPVLDGRLPRSVDEGWVVDEEFAKRYFPGRSAVGAELFYQPQGPDNGGPWPRIMGVVGRANLEGLEARDGQPVVYAVGESAYQTRSFTILVRTSRLAGDVAREMRAKLREIDPALPLSGVTTLQDALDRLLLDRRGTTLLIGCFAGLALLLSAIGVYGALANDVLQRTREIGIRVALGGSRRQILSRVVRQGLWPAGFGLGLGLVGAMALSPVLESRLFDVAALDLWTYVAAVCLLLVVALAASYIPARRALRMDPVESLRLE